MKAVILAAGIGSRLKELTKEKPKCMVHVNGRCIIDYQIEALLKAGIKSIYVVIGFQAAIVRAHLEHAYGGRGNVQIIENRDFQTTNNMYSLSLLESKVSKEPFLLLNGDVVFEPSILEDLTKAPQSAICVDVGAYSEESMKVIQNQHKKIMAISKNIRREQALGCSIDVYFFQKQESAILFEHIRKIIHDERRLSEWTEFAIDELLRYGKMQMSFLDIRGRHWFEIDNLEDLGRAEMILGRKQIDWEKIKIAFVDMDGTLYRGNTDIPGAADFVAELRKKVPHVYFLSNNSAHSHEDYYRKLSGFKIQLSREEILLSSDALAVYLQSLKVQKIYLVGTRALEEILSRHGIRHTDESPEAVVLGYDKELTYEKLMNAALLLQQADPLPYYATHGDVFCPVETGNIPDIGSLIALFQKVTKRVPDKILGKPHPDMVIQACKKHGVQPTECMFFGDRVYTDYQLAQNCGGLFVGLLSGESQREDYEKGDRIVVFPSVGEIFKT